jgi:hypothetical protein
MKKNKNQYIVVIPAPHLPGGRKKTYFPIDKPENKILQDIKDYLRKNLHQVYDVYRGREVKL